MEIKHTHPQYDSPAQRTEHLKDVSAACLAAVRKVRTREQAQKKEPRPHA